MHLQRNPPFPDFHVLITNNNSIISIRLARNPPLRSLPLLRLARNPVSTSKSARPYSFSNCSLCIPIAATSSDSILFHMHYLLVCHFQYLVLTQWLLYNVCLRCSLSQNEKFFELNYYSRLHKWWQSRASDLNWTNKWLSQILPNFVWYVEILTFHSNLW